MDPQLEDHQDHKHLDLPQTQLPQVEVEEEDFGDETLECRLSTNKTVNGFAFPLAPERE